ncbi:alpha/beta fold hydrolase [Piscinibacter sakaiensis]|uniref:Proline iminopeptidase n=1 Tax=Piscinibacter sakaiensis TaxID=1547922 RepID=A0A0K8P7F9_PISS1|nr:alpha/beta fold hydrolase [Piscinibacter sakaiensis]GAP38566.1 proline iminopeptidase [Piscinibacter sakaiensis]
MPSSFPLPGVVTTEREHRVPLVHADPSRGTITVFTRELAAPDGRDRPWLVFLQGGPGFEASRPSAPPSGWMARALADFRVLLLDQRGTGRSTPVGPRLPGATPAEQAEYLTHFRADAIVRDLECLRAELGIERWSLLGQSFGGFTALSYLSMAPEALREVMITGGLAPVDGRPVDDVYAATWARAREANARYHARYPGDRARLHALLQRLDAEDLRLPGGDRLTARRFRQLGLWLGSSTGFERLHHLLELPPDSPAFLWDVQQATGWERNPLYATLHESCYADGGSTRWSAHRLAPDEALHGDLLGGEHVFPWMWEEHGGLRAHRDAAHHLADHPWPRLYDPDRLARNEVPVAATVYVDDLYVERTFAEATARHVRGLRPWITNEYAHDGLRADGDRILTRLLDLVRGRA